MKTKGYYKPRNHPPIIGKKIHRLTIIQEIPASERGSKSRKVQVQCDCGVIKIMFLCSVKQSKSCGCWQRERMATLTPNRRAQGFYVGGKITHGMSRIPGTQKPTPEFAAWRAMISRCYRTKDISYPNYGGRGIQVCQRWRYSFQNFLTDMGMKPESTKRLTLERVKTNEDYSPGNCCWATYKQQRNNTRKNHYITINGSTKTLTEWCEINGISQGTASRRIHFIGWDAIRAVTQPVIR